MAQVWIKSTDMKDLVRADSVGHISIWNAGKEAFVGFNLGKDPIVVAEGIHDFGDQEFDDLVVLGKADAIRSELVSLIHKWEPDTSQWTVTLDYVDGQWITYV
ncbi:hypothetical protein [Paenarthrobacter nicotinovorans]|uniref:hypothetical protein n=1 Tax=Paenarthrobacter nicotinovorans TaxID=29320 RepID=UPI003DA2CD1B